MKRGRSTASHCTWRRTKVKCPTVLKAVLGLTHTDVTVGVDGNLISRIWQIERTRDTQKYPLIVSLRYLNFNEDACRALGSVDENFINSGISPLKLTLLSKLNTPAEGGGWMRRHRTKTLSCITKLAAGIETPRIWVLPTSSASLISASN